MTKPEVVNAAARAYIEETANIIEAKLGALPEGFTRWDEAPEEGRDLSRQAMRAALAAIEGNAAELVARPTDAEREVLARCENALEERREWDGGQSEVSFQFMDAEILLSLAARLSVTVTPRWSLLMNRSQTNNSNLMAELTRPIIGIERRTAPEVFAIMCDRIRATLEASEAEVRG